MRLLAGTMVHITHDPLGQHDSRLGVIEGDDPIGGDYLVALFEVPRQQTTHQIIGVAEKNLTPTDINKIAACGLRLIGAG